MFCSGACRVKSCRDKSKVEVTDINAEYESKAPPVQKPKPSLVPSTPFPVLEKIQEIQTHKMEEAEFILCEHGTPVWETKTIDLGNHDFTSCSS